MRRVCWPSEYHGDGNSFGYSVHNDQARRALVAQGFRLDAEAPVAVQVAPAQRFRPVRDKLNVLFTAWESTDLTPEVHAGLARADVIVVPASFLVEVIRRELPAKPVYRCPLGVDAETFAIRKRRAPDGNGRFRFLWLGAPNARKGWQVVLEAWRGYAKLRVMAELEGRPVPAAELYVKTSVTSRLRRLNVPGAPVTFDSRKLPREDLVELYRSAHAFLFPSFGEGFGLTMAEAMATGCPVIYTPWSAMTDLADESCGYPVRYTLMRHDLAARACNKDTQDAQDGRGRLAASSGPLEVPTFRAARRPHPGYPVYPVESSFVTFAQADAKDLLKRMLEVMTHYRRAARKGRLAARRIRERFTWKNTGRTLAKIIEKECARRLA